MVEQTVPAVFILQPVTQTELGLYTDLKNNEPSIRNKIKTNISSPTKQISTNNFNTMTPI